MHVGISLPNECRKENENSDFIAAVHACGPYHLQFAFDEMHCWTEQNTHTHTRETRKKKMRGQFRQLIVEIANWSVIISAIYIYIFGVALLHYCVMHPPAATFRHHRQGYKVYTFSVIPYISIFTENIATNSLNGEDKKKNHNKTDPQNSLQKKQYRNTQHYRKPNFILNQIVQIETEN